MKDLSIVDEIIAQYHDNQVTHLDALDRFVNQLNPDNVDDAISRLDLEWYDFIVGWARYNYGEGVPQDVLKQPSLHGRTSVQLEAITSWLARNPPTEVELQRRARDRALSEAVQAVFKTRPQQAFTELLMRARKRREPRRERYALAFASMPEEDRRQLDLFFDRVAEVDPTDDMLIRVRGRGGAR